MRLADFILENREIIEKEWDVFARSMIPEGDAVSHVLIRDHFDEILNAIVRDMNSFQSDAEQAEKSKGRGAERHLGGAGHIHAVMRLERGFTLNQLVAEYRALRASVLRLWSQAAEPSDSAGVVRFNEAIDEALSEAASRYVELMERYRDQFIGILGHDLRNPLSAIVMGAATLAQSADADKRAGVIAPRILRSAKRMESLVGDLLDLTRTRLGSGIPIHPAPMDLAPVCSQVVEELKAAHPGEPLQFTAKGDLHGEWDSARLAQVVSNLVGNAMQHGSKEVPATVVARDDGDEVVLEVHNVGPPIPSCELRTLFEPMAHHEADDDRTSRGLGLGLYIADQVVAAHGGTIGVTSTEAEGTTFIVHLPRKGAAAGAPHVSG